MNKSPLFYGELPARFFGSQRQVSEHTDPELSALQETRQARFDEGHEQYKSAKTDAQKRAIVRSFSASEWPCFCDYIRVDWKLYRDISPNDES
jgi:hypothetical protein